MEAKVPENRPDSFPSVSRLQRGLSAASVAVLILLAGGSAAFSNEQVLIGVPSFALIVLASFASLFTWTSGATGLAGFLTPVFAILLASVVPATSSFLLFSGRPLFVVALAGLVLAVVARRAVPPKFVLLPALFAIYAFVGFQSQTRVGPDGDEPQYLMVAQSILQDHDLALDQDFQEKRYEAFFSRPLDPHFRIRGPQGQIYSLHAIGLSILILPAYWLGGYAGASFFMALVAALLVHQIRRLIADLSGDERLAEGTAWLVGLSPPIIHFAGLIFTEIPAALLLCVGLRAGIFGRTRGSAILAASCAATLPWFNVRYAILSIAVVGTLAWRLRTERCMADTRRLDARAILAPLSILIGSAAAIGFYHFALWGFFDPRRVYGRSREFSLDVLPEGLPGLFLDQEFGLFIYAPIYVLSIAGYFALFRRKPVLALAGLVAIAGVVATASVWPMWRGGFNPPARFLVPLASVLAAGLGMCLQRGIKPATALLAGWSLWCGLGGALNIETVHRDRDGVAPFFRTQSGAREWTAALPSFVLSEDRPTRVLAWPWGVLLGIGLILHVGTPPRTARRNSNLDSLLASLALMATAMAADHLSPRIRAPERDATRLLGAPSLTVPWLRWQGISEAIWPLDIFYEPHRTPLGLVFSHELSLTTGRYELALSTTDAAAAGERASLTVVRHSNARATRTPLRADANGLRAEFDIEAIGEYDLTLAGGAPMAFKQARLRLIVP